MIRARDLARRWLLVCLTALGLILSGGAHHAVCHAPHDTGGCCEPSGAQGEVLVASDQADHAEHVCPLCFLGGTCPPTLSLGLDPCRLVACTSPAVLIEVPRGLRRSASSVRGPPVVV